MKILDEPQGKHVGKPILLHFNVMGQDCVKGEPSIKGFRKNAIEELNRRIADNSKLQQANAVLFGEFSSSYHTGFPSTVTFALVRMAVQLYKI